MKKEKDIILLIVLVLGGAHIIQVIQAGRLQRNELGHQDNLPRVVYYITLFIILYTGG